MIARVANTAPRTWRKKATLQLRLLGRDRRTIRGLTRPAPAYECQLVSDDGALMIFQGRRMSLRHGGMAIVFTLLVAAGGCGDDDDRGCAEETEGATACAGTVLTMTTTCLGRTLSSSRTDCAASGQVCGFSEADEYYECLTPCRTDDDCAGATAEGRPTPACQNEHGEPHYCDVGYRIGDPCIEPVGFHGDCAEGLVCLAAPSGTDTDAGAPVDCQSADILSNGCSCQP